MRTSNRFSPYPEEINRRIITQCADVHFAATAKCRQNLVDEGISPSSIFVTGNTVIDALLWIRDQVRRQPSRLPEEWLDQLSGRRLILVTGHRRESFGPGLEAICLAIKDLIARNEDIVVVYPVHPNPNVQEPVRRILAGQSRLIICKPFPYRLQVEMMDRAYLILTDSGGIQEEAPSLGKPVIVMREVTERIEGVEAGNAILVGTDRQCIVSTTETLLADRVLYKKMAQVKNPYGDGHAANRIVEILSRYN
jgi:UDP-N-acetylglucosamine 2-epimerase